MEFRLFISKGQAYFLAKDNKANRSAAGKLALALLEIPGKHRATISRTASGNVSVGVQLSKKLADSRLTDIEEAVETVIQATAELADKVGVTIVKSEWEPSPF